MVLIAMLLKMLCALSFASPKCCYALVPCSIVAAIAIIIAVAAAAAAAIVVAIAIVGRTKSEEMRFYVLVAHILYA